MGEQLAQEMDVPLSVLESHPIRQLNRTEDKWVTVGSLQGMDYFGDGSLWLLDTPGVSDAKSYRTLGESSIDSSLVNKAQEGPHICSCLHIDESTRVSSSWK